MTVIVTNCPRCMKFGAALEPHACPCSWTGKSGTACTACEGTGKASRVMADQESAPCSACQGQGAVDTPTEPLCKCCWACIARCEKGDAPEQSLAINPALPGLA